MTIGVLAPILVDYDLFRQGQSRSLGLLYGTKVEQFEILL